MLNIMKFRPLFFLVSSFMLLVSTYSIVRWNFVKGIDFVGGTVWEIKTSQTKNQVSEIFGKQKTNIVSISSTGSDSYLLKLPPLSQDQKVGLSGSLKKSDPRYTDLRYESLGPSLGKELLQKTVVAIVLSALTLLIFIGTRFKDYSFGVGAIIAMFHDAIILIGAFSLLGHFFGAELDALFVTALLTTLSASVHDTVVTFDRIRELKHQNFKLNWVELANQAVSETLVRSINNSMTVVFMLLSLVVLGGVTTRWFATALLVGVVCGTYSSTGIAIPLMLLWKRKK